MKRYYGGSSSSTHRLASNGRVYACRSLRAGDAQTRGTSLTAAHVTSGPLSRVGNWKQQNASAPSSPDRGKKLHPIRKRVKLDFPTKMRRENSPSIFHARGPRSVRRASPRNPWPDCAPHHYSIVENCAIPAPARASRGLSQRLPPEERRPRPWSSRDTMRIFA